MAVEKCASPFLLDKVMFDTGCFDKPCKVEILNQICQIAIRPHDETAEVVEGATLRFRDAMAAHPDTETLLLHGLEEPQSYDCLEPIPSLRQLCLSNCCIEEIPSFPDLEVLILWKCSFRKIDKMPSLKALAIVDSYVHPRMLATFLEGCPSLQKFSLIRSGDILNTRKDTGYYFSPCTNPLLFQTRNLHEIFLQGTLLPWADIVHNIRSNPQFTKLSISDTWLPDPFVAWMTHAMGSPSSTLVDLTIRDVQWSPYASLQLVNGLQCHSRIQRLDVSNTLWHRYSQLSLSQYLQDNKNIQEFKIASLVDPSMISIILDACANCPSLKCITIARNYLNSSAMCSLARLLQMHPSLEELDLSNCWAEDLGSWDDVLAALSANDSLKTISLERCQVGDKGAIAIGQALVVNTTLQSIDLCHNGIGFLGITALVEGLKDNCTLQRIFLHGNSNEIEAAVLLRNLVRHDNFNLRVVFLPESHLQEELQYYGALNYAGRQHVGDSTISHALWPMILERALDVGPEIAFHLLQQRPDLLGNRSRRMNKRGYHDVTEASLDIPSRSVRPRHDTTIDTQSHL